MFKNTYRKILEPYTLSFLTSTTNKYISIYLLLFIIAVIQLRHWGIAFFPWYIYSASAKVSAMPLPYDPTPQLVSTHITWLRLLLNKVSLYIYGNPLLYLISTLLQVFGTFICLFHLYKQIIGKTGLALLTLIVILAAWGLLGNGATNLIDPRYYYVGMWCWIFIYPALLLIIRQRYFFFAGVLLGLASLIEAPTGLSVFAGLFPGVILVVKYRQLDWKNILYYPLGFILVISPLVYTFVQLHYAKFPLFLSMSTWYHFLIYRCGAGDTTISYVVWLYGFNMLAVLLIYCLLRMKNIVSNTECLLLGCLGFISICLIVEIFHSHGVFFGMLTKLFFTGQFTRVYPLLTIFIVPLILESVFNKEKSISGIPKIIFYLFFAVAIILMERSRIDKYFLYFDFVVIFLCYLLLIKFRKIKFTTITFLYVVVIAILIQLPVKFSHVGTAWHVVFSNLAILLLVISSILYCGLRLSARKKQVAISLIILLVALPSFLRGGRMKDYLSLLKTSSAIYYTPMELFRKVTQLNSNYAAYLGFTNETDMNTYLTALSFIKDKRLPYGRVLSYPALVMIQSELTHMPGFILEAWDRSFAGFSISVANNLNSRLKIVYGKGMSWLYQGQGYYQDNGYIQRLRTAYSQLTREKLIWLGQTEGIRYVVTKTKYFNLKLLCRSGDYYVYQIPISEKWKKLFILASHKTVSKM